MNCFRRINSRKRRLTSRTRDAMKGDPAVSSPHAKRPIIVVYASVAPEVIVFPIISCIVGFPLLALLVICCLRRRAKLARERARRRTGNFEATSGAISLIQFSPVHRLVGVCRPMHRRGPGLNPVPEERSDPEAELTACSDVMEP